MIAVVVIVTVVPMCVNYATQPYVEKEREILHKERYGYTHAHTHTYARLIERVIHSF